ADAAVLPVRTTLDDLAIFGGAPAFEEPVHVGRPNIGDRARLLERVGDAVDRHWLTNDGVMVKEFERRVAELLGVEHCVAVSSGRPSWPTSAAWRFCSTPPMRSAALIRAARLAVSGTRKCSASTQPRSRVRGKAAP